MEKPTITLTTDDGKEIECEVLFTYHSKENNKDYLIFQPEGLDQVSAAIYVENENGEASLEKIETEEEWDMLELLVNDYFQKNQPAGGCGGGCASCGGGCDGGCCGDGGCDEGCCTE